MRDVDQEKMNRIVIILHNLGIPSHLDGYKYLKDLLYEKSNYFESKKDLYCFLAQKYRMNKKIIERSIRYAIDIGWSRGNYNIIEELFGYSININKSKPTNYEFILTVIEKLNNDL